MNLTKLDKCRELRLLVKSLDDKLEVLHAAAQRTTSRITKSPKSKDWHDPLPSYVDQTKALGEEYAYAALELLHMVLEVSKYLTRLPPTHEKVMRTRYFDGARTWADVSRIVNLSEDRCKAINSEARKKLEEME